MATGITVSNRVVTLLVLLFFSMSNGHHLLITEDTIGSLSDDFGEEVPHDHINKFPPICDEHVPPKCEPILLPFADKIVVLIPSVGPLKHLEFTNTSIVSLFDELSLTKCFRYIPKDDISNDLYVLCMKNHTHETTIVTYLIEYEGPTPVWFLYSNDYGTHIDLDSPLIVISSNFSGPEVLYIATNRGNTWLYIMHLSSGGDSVTIKSLPDTCTGPYELKHLYQSYALLKCSNRFVHIYDTVIGEFAKLPGVQGVTMISRCANSSSSFVMITHQGNILLNTTASDPLRSIPSSRITVNSHQLKTILSFTCHWNGSSTQLYFTTSQDDGMVYFLSVSLEHVAQSTAVTEAHQIMKLSTPYIPSYNRQPSIAGSAWTTALTDEDNNVQERVFINVITGASNYRLSNGLAYLLSYSDKPFHNHKNPEIIKPEENESDVTDPNGLPLYIIIILVIVCVVTAVISIVLPALLCKFPKAQRPGRPRGHRPRPRPIELVQVLQETSSHTSGDTERSMLANTSFNGEDEIPLENQSTNEDIDIDSYPQTAANFHPQGAVDSNPQATVDSNPQATVDSNPQATVDSNPQPTVSQITVDVHPQGAVDINPLTSTDSHPRTTVDSNPETAANSNPHTLTNSYPRTATDSPSHDIENTTNYNAQAEYIHEEFVPSVEASGPSQQEVVTGAVLPAREPVVLPNEPRDDNTDDETTVQ